MKGPSTHGPFCLLQMRSNGSPSGASGGLYLATDEEMGVETMTRKEFLPLGLTLGPVSAISHTV